MHHSRSGKAREIAEPHLREALRKPRVAAQLVPLRRDRKINEARIAGVDRTLEAQQRRDH